MSGANNFVLFHCFG